MRMIYLAHPFGGEQENVDKVEKNHQGLATQTPGPAFYSRPYTTRVLLLQPTYLS